MQTLVYARERGNTWLCNSRSVTVEILSTTVNYIFPFVTKVSVVCLRMTDAPTEKPSTCASNFLVLLHGLLQ